MFINAYDQARFGYLFLRDGEWDGRRIISEQWIEMARTPGQANLNYGFMNWFLNTPVPAPDGSGTRKPVPSAPDTAVAFMGAGSNIVYIDWENDLVVVIRWIGGGLNEFVGKVLASIER
jgi:CubicO group peptidase (beta-lactamase class C family)